MGITPDNAVFVLLSFEGPDIYSIAGGLGVRMSHDLLGTAPSFLPAPNPIPFGVGENLR